MILQLPSCVARFSCYKVLPWVLCLIYCFKCKTHKPFSSKMKLMKLITKNTIFQQGYTISFLLIIAFTFFLTWKHLHNGPFANQTNCTRDIMLKKGCHVGWNWVYLVFPAKNVCSASVFSIPVNTPLRIFWKAECIYSCPRVIIPRPSDVTFELFCFICLDCSGLNNISLDSLDLYNTV